MTGSALQNLTEEPAHAVKAKGTKRSLGMRRHQKAQLSPQHPRNVLSARGE